MKQFLIVSDTHGDLYLMRNIVNKHPQINAMIHLGDYYKDAVIIQKEFPKLDVFMVSGNCDFSINVPTERVLEIEGRKIFITHGHQYNVKSSTAKLEAKALKEGFNAVLYGHTHIPLLNSTPSLLVLNPGSMGYPRGSTGPTYAILEIGEKSFDAKIMKAS